MKIENKDFWEIENVIYTQDYRATQTSDYEAYLYEKLAQLTAQNGVKIENAKIFGCGTGREILGLMKYFDLKRVLGTDISENMIKKGNINIKEWNLSEKVSLQVGDATQFSGQNESYELVTLMNSVLTYVDKKEDRYKIFKASNEILKSGGYIIGSVHNQSGAPLKTIYFFLRRCLKPFLRNEPGNRMTGFKGYDVKGYYFTKNGLKKHLQDANFKVVEILSLGEYYKKQNVKYNKLKGWNNIIFIAKK